MELRVPIQHNNIPTYKRLGTVDLRTGIYNVIETLT